MGVISDRTNTRWGKIRPYLQDYIEHKLNERLLLAIIEILAVLDFFTGGIDIEETIGKLICYSDTLSFLRNDGAYVNITKLAA